MRGGSERTGEEAVAIDQQGANATDAWLTKGANESATAIVASGVSGSSSDRMAEETQEAPPPQPSVAGPSRRTVELLVGATGKTPAISTTGVLAPPPAAATPAAAETTPEAAAPPIQLTPTRSLVADSPPPAPTPPAAPAPSTQPVADTADAATASVAPAAATAPVTGGAAILARLRQQRADTAKAPTPPTDPTAAADTAARSPSPPSASQAAAGAPAAKPPVTVVYGSQTGTCQEIARNLAAEAVEKGFNASCASLNELGFAALSPTRTPILVVISSSTGDGDPPDNAAAFFVAMRRKPPAGSDAAPAAPLAGVRYTLLGLGDSNYTRFMYIPRSIKNRLAELGAREFYKCVEADEVEGVENIVEPWTDGLWAALATAVAQVAQGVMQVETVDGPAAMAPVAAAKPAAAAPAAVDAAAVAAAAAAVAAQEAAAREAAAREAAAREAAEREAAAAAARAAAEKAAAEKAAAEKAAAEKAAAEKAAAEKAAAKKAAAEKAAAEKAAAVAAAAAAAEKAAAEKAAALAKAAAPEPLDDLEAAMAALNDVLNSTSGHPADATSPKDAAPSSVAATAAPAAEHLLLDDEVSMLEAGAAPTSARAGLPTIKKSRVFEEEGKQALAAAGPDPAAVAAAAAATRQREEDPLLTPPEEEGRPGSDMGVLGEAGSAARRGGEGSRLSQEYLDAVRRRRSTDKPPSRLQAKPLNVNFPKREETVVKRKDESTYGMLLGLAPVGVDTKSAPALLPSRIRLQWEKDEGRARVVRDAEAARPSREERHRLDPAGHYSAAQPFWAHVSDARYETALWSDRKVLHLELSIRGSNIVYEPGDSIGVLPVNHPDLVANLCKRLNISPDRVFHVHPAAATAGGGAADGGRVASHLPSPVSVGYALSHCVDLTGVTRKSVLRLLAEHTSDAAEKRTLLFLAARGGKEAYAHEVGEHQPSILDLLVRFRTCNPPLEALLDALPPLLPRMYSISSSRRDPAGGPYHLSVAMSVVRFKTRYGTRLGVATTWLDRLAAPFTAEGAALPSEPIWVPVFLRPSADFKPPSDLATPLIMVGPGTGVAPFRGFLQDRRALIAERKPAPGSLGEAFLFFGCRRDDEDYLYKEDLEGFKADGTLTALHVAFSRAQADKVYVQDLLRQQGAKVWSLLQAGAHVYVCGDGAAMAKDVNAALVGIAQQHGGLGEADAAAYMQSLSQERRYVRDVWS